MIDPIRPWAKRYLEALGEEPNDRRLAAQRARLLLAHSSRQRTFWTRGARWAVASTCAVGAIGALLFLGRAPTAPTARANQAPVQVGEVLETSNEPQELQFVGGSKAVLEPDSRGTLSRYSEELVELTLQDGAVELDVTKRQGRRWIVRAGDFRVHVIGTAFTVSTNATSGAFSVDVRRGKVNIEGPRLARAVALKAGDRFLWTPEEATDEPRTKGTSGASRTEDPLPTPPTSPDAKQSPSPRLGAKSAKPDWQELARAGRHADAVEMVRQHGMDAVLSRSGPEDMILLGNTARFSGHWGVAQTAYVAARSSGEPATRALAAYYLARVALDGQGNGSEAIRWLRTYLTEAPTGELSASARARLMDLLEKGGDRASAKKVAAEYVSFHPNGPHIDRAKRLGKAGP